MPRTPLSGSGVALAFAALLVAVTVSAAPSGAVADPRPTVGTSGVDGSAPRVVTIQNTTNYLFPDVGPLSRQGYARIGLDVGSAVAVSSAQLESTFREHALAQRLRTQRYESDGQLAVVRQAVRRTERRVARLDATHRALYRGYNNGTLSQEELARRLARLEAESKQLRRYVDHLRNRAEGTLGPSYPSTLDDRFSELRAHLVLLSSPETQQVSEQLLATLVGDADSTVVYAGGAGDALVLATVVDGTFRRQTTLRSQHQPGQTNEFEQGDRQAIAQVAARASELYPWAYSGDHATSIGRAGQNLYRINSDYIDGELTAYISGSTTNVFHELHRQDPAALPVSATVTNETASLNLTVTTTVETGPMRVRLTDAGTATNATVLVDGQRVGTTGEDGRLWTVRPAGTFSVTAVTESGTRVVLRPGKFL